MSGSTGLAGSEITWLAPLPGGRGLVAATGDCRFLLFEPQVRRQTPAHCTAREGRLQSLLVDVMIRGGLAAGTASSCGSRAMLCTMTAQLSAEQQAVPGSGGAMQCSHRQIANLQSLPLRIAERRRRRIDHRAAAGGQRRRFRLCIAVADTNPSSELKLVLCIAGRRRRRLDHCAAAGGQQRRGDRPALCGAARGADAPGGRHQQPRHPPVRHGGHARRCGLHATSLVDSSCRRI